MPHRRLRHRREILHGRDADVFAGDEMAGGGGAIGAGGGGDVAVVAADGDGDVVETGFGPVCGVEGAGEVAARMTGIGEEDFDPGVGATFAEQVSGDVAGGETAKPAEREHDVGKVLADAATLVECLDGGGANAGGAVGVAQL